MKHHSSDRSLTRIKWFSFVYLVFIFLVSMACAGWDFDYSQRTNLRSNNYVALEFAPLAYYEDGRFAYAEGQFNSTDAFNSEILSEWATFLNYENTFDNLGFYLFEDSLASLMTLQNKSLVQNPNSKTSAFYTYLVHARKAESYALSSHYWWQEQPLDSLSRLHTSDLMQAWESEKFSFVKHRYAFQIIRNFFFAQNYLGAIDFYNRYVSKQPIDLVHLRCKGYVAGCYHRLEKYTQANLIYSELMSIDKRFTQSACQSFHPEEEIDFLKTIAQSQSTEQKICLWLMMAFYSGDDARAIREIRQLDANHAGIDLLYSRMLAKYESYQQFSGNLYWYGKEDKEASLKIEVTLEETLISLLQDAVYKRKNKLYGALSYFYHLRGQDVKAHEFINLAFTNTPKDDTNFINQLMVFRVVLKSKNPETLNAVDFDFLKTIFSESSSYEFNYYKTYQDVLHNIQSFLIATNHPAAALLFPRVEMTRDNRAIYAAIDYFSSNNQDALGSFCKTYAGYNLSQLYFLAAINHTFENQLDSTIFAIEQSEKKDDLLMADPFSMRIKDCHDCDFETYSGPRLSRLSFLIALKEKKESFEKAPTFELAVELGNAFYNLSYHGNTRMFSYLDYPMHGFSYEQEPSWYFEMNNPHFEVVNAESYYRKAVKLANTKEELAKAYFLISKCELANYQYGEDREDDADFIAQDGFTALKAMEDTKFRRMVLQECGYFQTYFKKK